MTKGEALLLCWGLLALHVAAVAFLLARGRRD